MIASGEVTNEPPDRECSDDLRSATPFSARCSPWAARSCCRSRCCRLRVCCLRLGQPDLLQRRPSSPPPATRSSHNLGLAVRHRRGGGFRRVRQWRGGPCRRGVFSCRHQRRGGADAVPPDALAGMTGKAADLAAAAFKAAAIFKLSVPLGIISGLIAGALYNRFGAIRLPEYLAFFGGRRFVPIVSGVARPGPRAAVRFGLEQPRVAASTSPAGRSCRRRAISGLFVYGVLNRLLIVTGLHHILNNIAWFLLGDFHGMTGDLNRFFAGDPSAGAFMAGFFPVMMFGLPAACLAMYHAARPDRRRGGRRHAAVAGADGDSHRRHRADRVQFHVPGARLFTSSTRCSPASSMVVMNVLHVQLGFGFSAGLFDYVLNFKGEPAAALVPVGLVYFGLYYGAVPLRDRPLRPEDSRPGGRWRSRYRSPTHHRRTEPRAPIYRGSRRRRQSGLDRRVRHPAETGGGRPGRGR